MALPENSPAAAFRAKFPAVGLLWGNRISGAMIRGFGVVALVAWRLG